MVPDYWYGLDQFQSVLHQEEKMLEYLKIWIINYYHAEQLGINAASKKVVDYNYGL